MQYQGETLKKIKEKTDGVNVHQLNGVYQTDDGRQYFIKCENNPRNLFMELFAGKVIEEFKNNNILEKEFHKCFIAADYCSYNNNHLMIQNYVKFTPLHITLGTSNGQGQRSPLYEIVSSLFKNPYNKIIEKLQHASGLSLIFIVSILLGDNSIHSSNIGTIDESTFVRFDFGAAFRDILRSNDIWSPAEYTGIANGHKKITKNYITYYTKIPGFLKKVKERAARIELTQEKILNILKSAWGKMPKDLFEIQPIAKYIGMDRANDFDTLFHALSTKIISRLGELQQMEIVEHKENYPLYNSGIRDVNHTIILENDEDSITVFKNISEQGIQTDNFSIDELNLNNEIQTLKEQIQSHNTSISTLKKTHEEEIQKLNSININLKEQIQSHHTSIANLKNTHEEEIKKLSSININKETTLKNQIQTLNEQIQSHHTSIANLKNTHEEEIKKLNSININKETTLKNQIQTLKEQIQSHHTSIANLKNTHEEEIQKLNSININKETTLKNQIQTLIEQIQSHHTYIANLKNTHKEEIQKLNSININLEEQIQTYDNSIAELTRAHEKDKQILNKKIEVLNTELITNKTIHEQEKNTLLATSVQQKGPVFQENKLDKEILDNYKRLLINRLFWENIWVYLKMIVLNILTCFLLPVYFYIKNKDFKLYGKCSIFTAPSAQEYEKLLPKIEDTKK